MRENRASEIFKSDTFSFDTTANDEYRVNFCTVFAMIQVPGRFLAE